MKPNLTTYSLTALILLCCYSAKSQNLNSTNQETIVKFKNPYGKGRTKWLKSNGFETQTYDWSNPEINLYLDQSLKQRSTGNIIGITGSSIVVLGFVANFMEHLSHEIGSSKPDEDYQVLKAPYYIGGLMVASSITLHLSSLNKLKRATKAQSKW